MMPESLVRRALVGQPLRWSLCAPPGAWIGCGRLRVLRIRTLPEEGLEMLVGYDAYERLG